MLRSVSCFLLAALLPVAHAATESSQPEPIKRVIYVTLDGVRWQDVFIDRVYFSKLWKRADKGKFYGAPDSHSTMEVASIPISLPSYQSQMAGAVQPCDGNGCGRIQVETLGENILHKLALSKKDVAVFSSWSQVYLSFEHIAGATYTNSGNVPVLDPETQKSDNVMADLNEKQKSDHPAGADRFDKYTFAQSLHYLEKFQPRFMWISLGDADTQAHHNNLAGYHTALMAYDDYLDTLFTTLARLHIDKETLVILTTDHGRGNGIDWTSHGPSYPESKQTWGFAMNGELKPVAQDGDFARYSTLSIRPTIEAALGV